MAHDPRWTDRGESFLVGALTAKLVRLDERRRQAEVEQAERERLERLAAVRAELDSMTACERERAVAVLRDLVTRAYMENPAPEHRPEWLEHASGSFVASPHYTPVGPHERANGHRAGCRCGVCGSDYEWANPERPW